MSLSSVSVIALLLISNHCFCQCPPTSGIYLMQRGVCYPNGSYFHDASIRIYPLMCMSPGSTLNGGQWVRAINGDAVICNSNSDTNPLRCTSVTSPNANLSLYLPEGQNFLSIREGFYQCCLPSSCSDPNTNIITANIFRWAEIAEIRVDLPSNITVLPQQYTLHAIKIGQPDHYFLQDATWYYESGSASSNLTSICNGQERSGYSCSVGNGTPLFISNATYDYNLTVTWNGENISSGIFIQSNNNGNHVFRFYLAFGNVIRNRYHTITVPDSSPTTLIEVNKTTTTVTLSWTGLDSFDADGYVINVTSEALIVQTVQVKGTNSNITTLRGLRGGTAYVVTVRAYQELLGPPSIIYIQTLPVIYSINWTLTSSITQLMNTQYRIDCLTTTDINPSIDVYWLVNEEMMRNSMYNASDGLMYNNTLLVQPNPLGVSVNVTCIAMNEGVKYSGFIILQAASSPPSDVKAFILDNSIVKVNWTSSSDNAEYIIEYATTTGTTDVVSAVENEIMLIDLLPASTYIIRVYSFIDLPSVNSTVTVLRFDVPSPVVNFTASNISSTDITVSWKVNENGDYVTYYTISVTPLCSELSSVIDKVFVSPHQFSKTYSYTFRGLYSGMSYAISVKTGNTLGESNLKEIVVETRTVTAPTNTPKGLLFNPRSHMITWNEVNCTALNGKLTGYALSIFGIKTHNTERKINANELLLLPMYNISVAALNSAGRGPFSNPILYTVPVDLASSNKSCSDGTVIGLGIVAGVLLMLLLVSITINIILIILACYKSRNNQTCERADENIVMKMCEPYIINRNETIEEPGVYESVDPYTDMPTQQK